MIWLLLPVLYVVGGVLAGGQYYAFFQYEFPNVADEERQLDTRNAIKAMALGPLAFFPNIMTFGFYWKWLWPGRKP